MTQDFLPAVFEADPCQPIDIFARRLIAIASLQNAPVLGTFNNHTLLVTKRMSEDEVCDQWSRATDAREIVDRAARTHWIDSDADAC